MTSVASPTHSPARGGDRLLVTDTISVDISGSLVDTPAHQLDSGSNQSGSDSGLGYSNTASDNTFNPKAARNLLGIAASSAELPQDNKNNNNASSANNPQNRITSTTTNSGYHMPASRQHNNSESACSNSTGSTNNKPVPLEGKAKAVPDFSSQANKSSPCASSALLSDSNTGTCIVAQQKNNERIFPSERENSLHHSNELASSSSSPPSPPSARPPNTAAPLLKSLLKRPNSSKSRDHLPKQSRKVSFNQTVIVFCEEIVTSSSSSTAADTLNATTAAAEHFDSQPTLPPPDDYQDHHSTIFGPPHTQYCDAKNSTTQLVNIRLERAIGESANNLDDKRLFSLLEDESLLESFHSQHGECDLSDDDFTGNSLNYLSIDAISDYDSDSESSSIVDRKDRAEFNSTSLLKPNTSHRIVNCHQSKGTIENEPRISNKENKNAPLLETGAVPLVEHKHQPAKIANQKLMPARMKVTPVEPSFFENQNLRKELDFNLNLPSKTVVHDRLHASVTQKTSTYAASKNFERSLADSSAPSKSTVSIGEQRYSNVQDLKDRSNVYGSDNSYNLQDAKLIAQVHRTGDCGPSIPSHQADPLLPGTKVAQESRCCHICQLIESRKFITQSTNPASRSQPTIRNDVATTVASAHNKNAHSDQANNFYNSLPLPNRPTVLSQSCVSCRELSKRQPTLPTAGPDSAGPQQVTPVACQVVYLVDQKGNLFKALSVVRSVPQNEATTDSSQPYRQLYVPTSSVLLPGACDARNQFTKNEGTQATQNGSTTSNSNNLSQLPVGVHHTQNQQAKLINARKQLVYYIRKPLDSQAPHQTAIPCNHITRAFPDPHEIRRLDGVKGPTSVSNLVNRETENATRSAANLVAGSPEDIPEPTADDSDDPTFGFSQRPSVKVVANFIKPPQEYATQPISNDIGESSSVFSSESLKQNFMGVHPPYILKSQTLDRSSHHQTVLKEGVPSTSSMSNINEVLSTLPAQILPSNNGRPVKNDNGNDAKADCKKAKNPACFSRWLYNKLFE